MGFIKGFFKLLIHSFFSSAVITLSISAFAGEVSTVDAESIEKTVKLLNSKIQRQGAIDASPDASKANEMAKGLFGDGADLDQVYKAASEIFRKLANDSKGDTPNMMEVLSKAQADPEGFYKNMTPEQQEIIKNLGKTVDARRKKAQP